MALEADPGIIEASRFALMSRANLDAVPPAQLTSEVRQLQKWMQSVRRINYTVLLPFTLIATYCLGFSVMMLLTLVLLASIFTTEATAGHYWFVAYWMLGIITYFVLGRRNLALVDKAARSVGLTGDQVMTSWAQHVDRTWP